MSASNLDPALPRAERVLFLCSGNIMRSAFAELFARASGFPRPVESGAVTYRNDRLHPATVRALAAHGVGPEGLRGFRPRHLDEVLEGLARADRARTLVLGMTREHVRAASGVFDDVRLLTSVTGGADEVPDPIDHADPMPVFEHVARLVERWDAHLRGA